MPISNNDLASTAGMNDGIKLRIKSGSNTLSSIFSNLNAPAICFCSTENISDKPSGKYGVVLILKASDNRMSAICITIDGLCYINSYNTSSSALTNWKQL